MKKDDEKKKDNKQEYSEITLHSMVEESKDSHLAKAEKVDKAPVVEAATNLTNVTLLAVS